jgi:hypothetical protein
VGSVSVPTCFFLIFNLFFKKITFTLLDNLISNLDPTVGTMSYGEVTRLGSIGHGDEPHGFGGVVGRHGQSLAPRSVAALSLTLFYNDLDQSWRHASWRCASWHRALAT